MSEQLMIENFNVLGKGFEVCAANRLQLPALAILYTSIDITAWLADDNTKVGERFTGWVDRYLLKAKSMPCTACDLYGARCGILHTFTPDSDLNAKGKARLVCYAWAGRSAAELHRLVTHVGMDKEYVVVQIEELYEAWKLGVKVFLEELKHDSSRAVRVYAKAAKSFDVKSTATIDRVIAVAKRPGGPLA